MFAVVGVWDLDPSLSDERQRGLAELASRVAQVPGFVSGYWTGAADESRSHTFIVFADRASADEFAENVRGNAANQARAGVQLVSLTVSEVAASA